MADAADKPPFDIYAVLLVLTFVVYLGGFLLVNDDLSTNYGFKLFGEADKSKRSSHITELHDVGKDTPYVVLRKEDLDDYKAIKGGQPLPVKGYEWPEGYDVYKFPIVPEADNTKLDPAQLTALLSTADKAVEEAPKTDTPTTVPGTTPSDTATTPSTTGTPTTAPAPTTTPAPTPAPTTTTATTPEAAK